MYVYIIKGRVPAPLPSIGRAAVVATGQQLYNCMFRLAFERDAGGIFQIANIVPRLIKYINAKVGRQ